MLAILLNSLSLLAILLLPAVGFAFVAHFLEFAIQRKLASAFGWGSVLWTGWLGTPIHELSHVAFCILFGHRIEELRLFDPDIRSGRLGYVKHSYRRGRLLDEFGNVFIGTAPLMGGSLAMLVFLYLLFPSLARDLMHHEAITNTTTWGELLQGVGQAFTEFIANLFSLSNITSLRLWIFLYLTLCVASHMAPSASDYQGAGRGAILAFAMALGASIVLMAIAADPFSMALTVFQLSVPIILMAILSLVLCFIAWLVVSALVQFTGRRLYS